MRGDSVSGSHSAARVAITALAQCCIAATTMAQRGLPAVYKGPEGSRYFGHGVASGGDADGDGFHDILVSDKYYRESDVTVGRCIMLSGRDGRELWRSVGRSRSVRTPLYIAPEFIGDIDDDGCDDVITGWPSAEEVRGRVEVRSGRTGEELFLFVGAELNDRLGRDVAGVGDVDGDGVPDFAFVAAWLEVGTVSIRSGRDGSEIHNVSRPWPRSVAGVGDLDGDGRDDFAVGGWNSSGRGVAVFSGRTGQVIYDLPPPDPADANFGWSIAGGHDIDGDRVPDFITSGNSGFWPGRVYLFSGATGEVIGTMAKDSNAQVFGVTLGIADVTGDGRPEVVVGDHQGQLIFDPPSARLLHWSPSAVVESGVYYGTEYALGDVNGDGLADFIAGRNDITGHVILDAGAPMLLSPVPFTASFRRGREMDLHVSGAHPGRVIQLLATRHGSSCTYIGRLQICIDLARPFITVAEAVADIEGMASFSLPISPETPTGSAWLQALDPRDPHRGAITSNVLEILVTP